MPITMATPFDFAPYPWMKFALEEYGTAGIPGARHNPRVLLYQTAAGGARTDETAWCSAFANWCMRQAGINGTGQANARSWLNWGERCLSGPVFGAVTVFSRPPIAWQGHVAFYVGQQQGKVIVLGGNQSNSVCVKGYPVSRVLGYRWPKGLPLPKTVGGLAARQDLVDAFARSVA